MTGMQNHHSSMMAHCASARCAEASFSCAQSASNSISAILGATFVASIIICALLVLAVLSVSLLVLVLTVLSVSLLVLVLAVLLVVVPVYFPPRLRKRV